MSRNTFLTSSIILGLVVSPAMADDVYTSNLANSCNTTILGGDGEIAANSFEAVWEAIQVPISAGSYLPARAVTGTTCPANSYCSGDTYTFSETNDQGITGCPSGFGLSAAGSSAQTDCYRTCATTDVAHSASVSGGYYYGNNNQCSAESCVTGYHPETEGASLEEIKHNLMLKWVMSYDGLTEEEVAEQYPTDEDIYEYMDSEGETYYLDGQLELIPSADAYLKSIKSNADIYAGGNSLKYKSASGTGSNSSDTSGLENGEWSVRFNYGSIKGTSKCTATNGEYGYQGNPDATTSGEAKYCWCHADELDGNPLVSSWVSRGDYGDAALCANICANYCAIFVSASNDARFRGALFGSAGAKKVCVANEITITWDQANGQGSVTNTCTYDGDITLPTAPEKTGYTFSGWKLVTGSSSN